MINIHKLKIVILLLGSSSVIISAELSNNPAKSAHSILQNSAIWAKISSFKKDNDSSNELDKSTKTDNDNSTDKPATPEDD